MLELIETLVGLSLSHKALPLQQGVNVPSSQGVKVEEENKRQEALVMAWNKVNGPSEEIGEKLAAVQDLARTGLAIEEVAFKQGFLSVRGSALESKSVQAMIQTQYNFVPQYGQGAQPAF